MLILLNDCCDIFIAGSVDKPHWDHILFAQCHNMHLEVGAGEKQTFVHRLDNWTDGYWKVLIDEYKTKYSSVEDTIIENVKSDKQMWWECYRLEQYIIWWLICDKTKENVYIYFCLIYWSHVLRGAGVYSIYHVIRLPNPSHMQCKQSLCDRRLIIIEIILPIMYMTLFKDLSLGN